MVIERAEANVADNSTLDDLDYARSLICRTCHVIASFVARHPGRPNVARASDRLCSVLMSFGITVSIKACLQSAAGEETRDEIEEAGKAGISFFVASREASESLERTEEVLDQMAPFVHFGVVRDALGAVGLGRDDRCSAAFIEVGAQPVVIEVLVADQGLKIETGNQRLDANAVVALAG